MIPRDCLPRIHHHIARAHRARLFRTTGRATVTLALCVALLAPVASIADGIHICDTGPVDRPLPPVLQEILEASRSEASQDDGSSYGFVTRVHRAIANREAVAAGRMTREQAEANGGLAITGTVSFPVFPFLFDNTPEIPFPKDDLHDQLFGAWPTGSMRDYYEEVSYGQFSIDGYVDPWFTVEHDDVWYEQDDWGMNSRLGILITEILDARDPSVDFSQYDNDGPDGMPNTIDDDGYVDFFVIVSPELGGVCSQYNVPDTKNLWSHRYKLSGWTGSSYESDDPSNVPGVAHTRINEYFLASGLHCDDTMNPIGTYCHEFGHALDIKDLYDTVPWPDADSEGLGHWGLMSRGNRNTEPRPAHMIAWSKERLGWLSYYNVTQDVSLSVPPVETSPFAVRMWTHGALTDEYFLIENRQPIGFDENVAGSGLLIYHVDQARYEALDGFNEANAYEDHKAIDLECADASTAEHTANADDLDTETNRGDAGDPWCPSTQADFHGGSVPDSRSYSDEPTGVEVRNISSCNGVILADFVVGIPLTANLCMIDCNSDDCSEPSFCDAWWGSPDIWIDNDDDGVDDVPAEGIGNHLWFRVRNAGPDVVAGAEVRLYYGDPAMGQHWPSTGTLIGQKMVGILGPGEAHEDFVVFEYPDPPDLVDHYCIGAVASHSVDIPNSEYPPNDNNVAQVNHQVLVRRADNGPLAGSGGSLLGSGHEPLAGRSPADEASLDERSAPAPGGGLHVESLVLLHGGIAETRFGPVLVGSPPDFDDAEIPDGWTVSFDPGPYTVPPGGRHRLFVTMDAPAAQHGETAYVPLTFFDAAQGRAHGGVILEYRIDNLAPLAPASLIAEEIGFRPDDLDPPTVKVTWDKVGLESGGLPEVIEHYEVYRSDNQGNPEALVDRVAIDARPDEDGFQWFDSVLVECPVVYTYRVRGVDAAHNAGAFAVGDLVCAAASVPDDPGDGSIPLPPGHAPTALRIDPHPVRNAATIRFGIADAGRVRIDIVDPAGRVLSSIVDADYPAGEHRIEWRRADGLPLPSGVYFCRIETAAGSAARKLLLLE